MPYFSDSHIPKGGTDVTDERSAVTPRKLTLRSLRWAAATDPKRTLTVGVNINLTLVRFSDEVYRSMPARERGFLSAECCEFESGFGHQIKNHYLQ